MPSRLSPLAAALLLVLAACSSGSHSSSPTTSSRTSTSARSSTTAAAPTSTSVSRGTTTITFNGLVFHAPNGWGVNAHDGSAVIGVLAGGPDQVNLRVTTGFSGSIDTLQPTQCHPEGGPPVPVQGVALLDSASQLVASKPAQFRRWRVTCPDGKVEEHRAWLVVDSKVAIYEQRLDAANDAVVATAEIP